MKTVIFINSHPIQYFAPLYRYMNEQGVKTKAWYCSRESIKGGIDKQFNVNIKWDIPLLDGYEYKFYKNYSWKPSHFNGFFGLINLGIVGQLFREPKSVIIVHGWHYFTHMLVIIFGHLIGHTICLRNETPLQHESLKRGWKQRVRRFVLKRLIFPWIHFFLYIGKQNKLFYKSFNIAEAKFIFCPYSVDNFRFKHESYQLKGNLSIIRRKLGIPEKDKVILYSGKYIEKKRPLDLLQAFVELNSPECWLLMMGEGDLRKEMEEMITKHSLKKVILTGFVNQSKIAEFYAISDVFVMCSGLGETWGLSVNEAMNFNLPVIVSDLTGCSDDLVKNGDNGYVFKTGEIDQLVVKLKEVLIEKKLSWKNASETLINYYSYSTIVENVKLIY